MLTTVMLLLLAFPWEATGSCVVHIESMEYPEIARMARIQGDVKVRTKVAPGGHVISAVSDSGNEILRREAEKNAKKWVFSAGEGRELEILYQFKLQKPEVDYRPPTKVTFDLPGRVLVLSSLPALSH